MNRRDFLLFRTERDTRVVELSFRRLALRDLEWRLTASTPAAEQPIDSLTDGEPPAAFDTPSVDQSLTNLARDLQPRDLLRVVDADWSLPDSLRRRVDEIAATHRARGGRVETGHCE